MTRIPFFALLLAALVFSSSAHAKIFDMSIGVRAGAGVELWTEPSGGAIPIPGDASFRMPVFDDTRSGYSYSIGPYVEFRFVDHLGIEIGALFGRHTLLEDTDWSYEIEHANGTKEVFEWKTKEEIVFTSVHIPVLVKGILPVGIVRLSLGIGPEFVIGQYAYGTFEHTSGDDPQGDRAVFRPDQNGQTYGTIGAQSQTDTYLTTALSVDIDAGDFRIPIDFRFSYNFNQPGGYYDRIAFDQLPSAQNPGVHPTRAIVKARDSMHFQMLIGVAMDLF